MGRSSPPFLIFIGRRGPCNPLPGEPQGPWEPLEPRCAQRWCKPLGSVRLKADTQPPLPPASSAALLTSSPAPADTHTLRSPQAVSPGGFTGWDPGPPFSLLPTSGWAQGRGRRPWERVQSKGDQPPPSAAPLICSGQRTRCCLRNALLGPRCPELISRSSFPMKNYEPVQLLTLSCRSHYPAPNQTPSSPKVGTRPSCLPPLCPPSNSRGLGTEREIRIQGMTGSMSRGKPRIVTQTCLQIFCL